MNKTVYIWGEKNPLFENPLPIIDVKNDFKNWRYVDERSLVYNSLGDINISYSDEAVVSPVISKNASENHIQIKTNQWQSLDIPFGTIVYIRGSSNSFNQFSSIPSWQEYIGPVYEPTWRYVQVKVEHNSSSSSCCSSSSSCSSCSSSSHTSSSSSSSSQSSSSLSKSSSSKSSSSKSSSSLSLSSSSLSSSSLSSSSSSLSLSSSSSSYSLSSSSSSSAIEETTWNNNDKNQWIKLTNNDFTAFTDPESSSGTRGIRATVSHSSGRLYFETLYTLFFDIALIGIANISQTLNNGDDPGDSINSYGYKGSNGNKRHNGSGFAYGDAWGDGDIIGVALDLNLGKIWFSTNGIWQNGGKPSIGANPCFSSISGTYYPMVSLYAQFGETSSVIGFFASGSFTYSIPTLFSAWDD